MKKYVACDQPAVNIAEPSTLEANNMMICVLDTALP